MTGDGRAGPGSGLSPAGDGSPALVVVAAGLRTLIVDDGRYGRMRLGIPRSGAADPVAHTIANLLCGNGAAAAALEVTVSGPVLEVAAAAVVVAATGDVDLTRQGHDGSGTPLQPWRSHRLERGERLVVGRVRGTARAIVAVGGGLLVDPQGGSRSTSLRGGVTGLLARPLVIGDRLAVSAGGAGTLRMVDATAARRLLHSEGPLRILPGPQDVRLAPAGWTALTETGWVAAPASDRVAVRLEGPPLHLTGGHGVPPQGMPHGAVQVPGDGCPLLLGVDRGTTGGYAVPAVVAGVDLPRLGRIRPGTPVRLDRIDIMTARRLLAAHRAEVGALLHGLRSLP